MGKDKVGTGVGSSDRPFYPTGELVVRRNREFKKIRDSRYKKAQGVEIICRLLIRHRQGEKSGLWREFQRIIWECKPSYAIIENVANLRSKGLVRVLRDLWQIGYDAEWEVISAAQVGAPHLRERIWIISYPRGTGRSEIPRSVHENEKENGSKNYYVFNCLVQGPQLEVTNPTGKRRERRCRQDEKFPYPARPSRTFWEETESPICGVGNGLPEKFYQVHNRRGLRAMLERERQERVKALGNAVVPQIVELIGKKF